MHSGFKSKLLNFSACAWGKRFARRAGSKPGGIDAETIF